MRRAPLLLALFAAAFFVYRAHQGLGRFASGAHVVDKAFAEAGEALLHRLPSGSVPARMPAFTVGAAVLLHHAPLPWRESFSLVHLGIALAVLGLAAGLTGSAVAGAAAVLALALLAGDLFEYPYYSAIQALGVLGAAWAWAALETGRRRFGVLLLAASVGAALLVRSSLLLLPAVVAARLAWRDKRASGRAWAALLLPYAALLPWVYLHRVTHGQWLFFEADGPYHGPLANVVTAVLGIHQSVEGDFRPLMAAGPDGASHPYLWVARRILERPHEFLWGMARRLWLALSWQPVLAALAAAGLWRRRREAPFAALGLLAGYYLAVHSLMSIQRSYLIPLWPVLAVLACGLWPGRRDETASRLGWRCALAPAAGLWALGLFAGALSLAYTRVDYWALPERVEGRVDALLARRPEDPWLLAQKGRARGRAGDWSGAALHLGRAAQLLPRHYEIEAARARLFAGDPGPALALDEGGLAGFEVAAAKVSARLRVGGAAAARAQLLAAFDRFDRETIFFRDPPTAGVERARGLMARNRRTFAESVWALEAAAPADHRMALKALLLEVAPGTDLSETAAAR